MNDQEKLQAYLEGDEEVLWDDELEEHLPARNLFRAVARMPDLVPPQVYACGDYTPTDSALALYRLLYLLEPPIPLDFSDHYKQGLFWFCNTDQQWLISVELWKHRLALWYYSADPQMVRAESWGGSIVVVDGVPRGKRQCLSPEGDAWFLLMELAVEHRWPMYDGLWV